MTDYPQPCRRFDARHPPTLVICTRCKAKVEWDVTEGDPMEYCARHWTTEFDVEAHRYPLPERRIELTGDCGGELAFRWQECDCCPNCDKMEWGARDVGGCCSRACSLQWEYRQSLGTQDAGPPAEVVPITVARSARHRRT